MNIICSFFNHTIRQYDDLTGLYCRGTFRTQVDRSLKKLERATHSEAGAAAAKDRITDAFLLLDVDHFKEINDTYGHPTGDRALSAVAAALTTQVRRSDIAGRLGGDEFAIFLQRVRSLEEVQKKAEAIAESIRSAGDSLDHPLHITVSIGIALAQIHGRTFDELYTNADHALYHSKRGGRACCHTYQAPTSELVSSDLHESARG